MHLSKPAIVICAAIVSAAFTAPLTAAAAPAAPSTWNMTVISDRVPQVAAAHGLRAKLSRWYVQDGVVHIGLTSVNSSDRALLKDNFGDATVVQQQSIPHSMEKREHVSGRVRIVHDTTKRVKPSSRTAGPQPNGTQVTVANRLSDVTPYNGGDRISSVQGESIISCTANYSATAGSAKVALTAGHCGPTGTQWQQGYYSNGTIISTGSYGTDKKTFFNTTTDAEYLQGASLSPSVWLTYNPTGNSSFVTEYGSGAVAKGASICADGSYTNLSCGGKVTAVNECANVSEDSTIVKVCGLDEATSSKRLTQQGDSGGPVILGSAPTHSVLAGVISAGNTTGTDLLFSDANIAASKLGVTVTKAS